MSLAEKFSEEAEPKTLFVVASYTVGKEKVFLSIAHKLGCKIFVEPKKLGVLEKLHEHDILPLRR